MGATIKDVAKLAGVSIKTVSNVLNGYPYLTEATKSKVEKAMAELDYRPNIAARNLRRGRTGVIALALPNLSSPYFAEIAQLVVGEAGARDLTVLVDATDGDLEREKLVADGFRSQLLDGMILQPWSVSAQSLRERGDRSPLVLLGERRVMNADSVAIDSRAAAYAAVEHLLTMGRRRIVAIGSKVRGRGGRRPQEPGRRHKGYEEALAAFDVPFDPDLLSHPEGDHTPEAVARAVDDLFRTTTDVDAFFAFNDRVALGVMRALLNRGVRIPDDIAVIGIDDIEAARLNSPSLSTVAPDKAGIARTALEMLADRIAGSDRPARQVVADFTLIERESTKPR
ncbi:LacI family DNA-binding transcriptional regulator [Phytoactinopolyspora halotolerans]|uniref:LacI family transcriptional regulator n=1 Tax=Phytoactinopolyspora halotolerans TaxID=1981512 RepID=A0A6L9S3C5_9ACTN|nr:LacI family DNA-binding transcriptional regulator [Phytoactinopolyspora halotolerans]NED99556.1 LacI family transcriptional regulator [Phytoactinopolyspora halotolerans]